MRPTLLTGVVLALLVAGHPPRVLSQAMPDGTWHGWLQETGQDSIRISFAVQHDRKHILMTMRGRSGVTYDMADIKLKDDVLTFSWAMGLQSFLYCRLSRRDGHTFEGVCNDRRPGESGQPVRVWMTMSPPDSTE